MGKKAQAGSPRGDESAGQDARPTVLGRKAEVRCHSGYKGEEYPKSFFYEGKEYEVAGILNQSLEEDSETKERKRIFTVETDSGLTFKLIHFEHGNIWEVDVSVR